MMNLPKITFGEESWKEISKTDEKWYYWQYARVLMNKIEYIHSFVRKNEENCDPNGVNGKNQVKKMTFELVRKMFILMGNLSVCFYKWAWCSVIDHSQGELGSNLITHIQHILSSHYIATWCYFWTHFSFSVIFFEINFLKWFDLNIEYINPGL